MMLHGIVVLCLIKAIKYTVFVLLTDFQILFLLKIIVLMFLCVWFTSELVHLVHSWRILKSPYGKNEWKKYFRNQQHWKCGRALMHSVALLPFHSQITSCGLMRPCPLDVYFILTEVGGHPGTFMNRMNSDSQLVSCTHFNHYTARKYAYS